MLNINNDLVGKYICKEYFHYLFFYLIQLFECVYKLRIMRLIYQSLNSRHCQIVARRWAATGSLVLYITVCTSMHNGTRPCHRTVSSCRAYLGNKRRASTKEQSSFTQPDGRRFLRNRSPHCTRWEGKARRFADDSFRFERFVGILSSETSGSIWEGKRSHSRYYLEFSSCAPLLLFSAKTITIDSSADTLAFEKQSRYSCHLFPWLDR